MKWWLSSGEKPEGPFPADHVVAWLKSGQISPNTMACPEGANEWKALVELNEFSSFVPRPAMPPPPPPPPPSGEASTGPGASVSASGPTAKFGILTAAIVLSGASLLLELLTVGNAGEEFSGLDLLLLANGIAVIATWAIFHYRLWALLPEQYAETTPGKAVGYMFIPFFNCYWVFQSYMGVNRGLNRLADAHGLPQPRANMNLAIAASIFVVVAWAFMLASLSLPSIENLESEYVIRDMYDLSAAYNDATAQHAGFNLIWFVLSSAPGFVLWLLMVLNQKKFVEHLLNHRAPLNTASGLVETK